MNEDRWELTLFIAGRTVRSVRAIRSVRRLFPEQREQTLGLEVVDVLDEPDRAEEAGIVATPTLVRRSPTPERRVIGDLTDSERLADVLDVPISIPEVQQ